MVLWPGVRVAYFDWPFDFVVVVACTSKQGPERAEG